MRRPLLLLPPALFAAWTCQAAAPSHVPLSGVNIAGGEFNSGRKPGVYGKDYIYPDNRIARPFIEQGMAVVRVPVLWERLQPIPEQPLSTLEMRRLDKSFEALAGFRYIIIDIHNYGKLQGRRLDQIDKGKDYLADLWSRLAAKYKDDPRIVFGLMNEPNGISAADWRAIAEHSTQAIRKTGARNLILVPGTNWSGAHSWTSGGERSNAAAFRNFKDPARNFAFEMHQYLDADSAGMKMNCQAPETVQPRMAAATRWLRDNGYRGFLGEFGAAPDDNCLKSLAALLDHMRSNADVWMGWTYWAAGGWWGRYPFSIQPLNGETPPQTTILARYSRRGDK
ncbi:MAG: glycoside hydrolase family 5 protein [Sphingobium sp.]